METYESRRDPMITAHRPSGIDMDIWAARRHARYFEKLFGVETAFTAKRRPRAPAPASAAPEEKK